MANTIIETQKNHRKPRYADVDAAISWILGTALIVSGIPHWGNPYFFLGSVYAYDLVDPGLGQLVAMTLPTLQLILGVCLITGLMQSGAHLLTLSLLLAFAVLQTSAKLRGLDISCGCFGPRHETTIGWQTLSIIYTLLMLSLIRHLGGWWTARKNGRAHRTHPELTQNGPEPNESGHPILS